MGVHAGALRLRQSLFELFCMTSLFGAMDVVFRGRSLRSCRIALLCYYGLISLNGIVSVEPAAQRCSFPSYMELLCEGRRGEETPLREGKGREGKKEGRKGRESEAGGRRD
jgi:hypothetical protein